jgi:hypothetical protein
MGALRIKVRKGARRIKVRRRWIIQPRTRVVPAGTVYERAKKKKERLRSLKEGEEDITA